MAPQRIPRLGAQPRVNAAQRRTGEPPMSTGVKRAPWAPASDLEGLGVQQDNLRSRIDKYGRTVGANGTADPRQLARLKQVNQAIRGLRHPAPVTPPVIDPSTGGGHPTEGQPPIVPSDEVDPGVTQPGSAEGLFPSIRAFEPSYYEGSPLYQFQKREGERGLDRILSKRGLRDSGAEIQAYSDFNQELGGVESDKARGYAEKEADRLERIQQNESLRRERGENRAGDDMFRWTDMMLRQNPMEYAYGGTGKYADTVGRESEAIANFMRNNYPRAVGGGGGGGVGPFVPPFPSTPDFSGIDTIGSVGSGSSNNDYFNTIMRSIGAFFQ